MLAPQWAPDGARLFAQLADFNRKLSFAWLDLGTRQLTPLPVNGDGALSPSLSPDGRQIAFHVIDEGGVINVLDAGCRRRPAHTGDLRRRGDVVPSVVARWTVNRR